MRFETNTPSFTTWGDGDEYLVGTRSAILTLTRRATTIAIRFVCGNKKTRWTRDYETPVLAELSKLRIARTLKLAGYTVLDGEDIKVPAPDPHAHWKEECMGREGDDARLVYADYLTERRDPRGELIVAQAGAEEYEAMAILKADRLMIQNRSLFLGPFDDRPSTCVQWRRGFVDSLIVERSEDERLGTFDLTQLLVACLTHPSGELVRELTIGLEARRDQIVRNASVCDAVALLTALGPPSVEGVTLQSRSIAGAFCGDITSLFASLPRLQRMTVKETNITLTPFVAPGLIELTLSGTIDDASLEALTMATCPVLDRLSIAPSAPISSNTAALLQQTFGSRLELHTW